MLNFYTAVNLLYTDQKSLVTLEIDQKLLLESVLI